jgi:hypothetical protein
MPRKSTKKAAKKVSDTQSKAVKAHKGGGALAKYPRHNIERSLRIPKAILEQNAGQPCTPEEAAGYLGVGFRGPFTVEISQRRPPYVKSFTRGAQPANPR